MREKSRSEQIKYMQYLAGYKTRKSKVFSLMLIVVGLVAFIIYVIWLMLIEVSLVMEL